MFFSATRVEFLNCIPVFYPKALFNGSSLDVNNPFYFEPKTWKVTLTSFNPNPGVGGVILPLVGFPLISQKR